MKRAGGIEDFVARPVGHFYAGSTYLVWCASPGLCGSTHWGRPSERDARELTRLYDCASHPSLTRFDVFMDDSAVEHMEWRALRILSEYLKSRLPEWGLRIQKQAVVTPPGMVGLVLAGLMQLLGPTYPIRYHASRSAALEWLQRDDLTAVLDQVDRLVGEARGVPPVVRALRCYLERQHGGVTVEEAARALQRSARSLQRELRRVGTGFGAELTRARVRSACMLLAHTDEKVESIAYQVGCLTSSRLSTLFRRELGETPMGYRVRHRADGAAVEMHLNRGETI